MSRLTLKWICAIAAAALTACSAAPRRHQAFDNDCLVDTTIWKQSSSPPAESDAMLAAAGLSKIAPGLAVRWFAADGGDALICTYRSKQQTENPPSRQRAACDESSVRYSLRKTDGIWTIAKDAEGRDTSSITLCPRYR